MPKPANRTPGWGVVPAKFEARLLSHHQPAPQNKVLVFNGDWSWGYWNGQCFTDEDGFTIYDVVAWAYPPKIEVEVSSDA